MLYGEHSSNGLVMTKICEILIVLTLNVVN